MSGDNQTALIAGTRGVGVQYRLHRLRVTSEEIITGITHVTYCVRSFGTTAHYVLLGPYNTMKKKLVCPATPLILMNPMHQPVTMAKNYGFYP